MKRCKDYSGLKRGRLTAISFDGISNRGAVWLFRCDCGTVKKIKAGEVFNGKTYSCGCLRKEMYSDYNKPLNRKFIDYKSSAKKRGYSFDLNKELFESLVLGNCHYCGHPASPQNGVDRMHNNTGYTTENSVSCCDICNRAKREIPYIDFLAYIKRIRDNKTIDYRNSTL